MYIIKYKNILLAILLVIGLIFLSGCSGECKENSDCPSKSCYTVTCEKEECVEKPELNCCGNNICEDGETKCDCERDCGKCTGDIGEYLGYVCEEDECVAGIKDENINSTSFTDKILLRNVGDISATYIYDQPFNLDESLFNVRFVLEKKNNDIEYIKINKVNIYEQLDKKGTQVQTYGEKIIDRVLWDTRTDVVDDVILSLNITDNTEENKQLTVEVIYEYAKLYRGQTTVTGGSYKKQLNENVVLVNPGKEQKCPSSCDDANSCTVDSCSASTNYFCEHTVKEGVSCCGNNKCDTGEDKCSCQQDCGYCEREFGEYIEYTCVSNKCSSRLRAGVVPKTLIEEANMKDLKIEMQTTFNEPFDINLDNYKVDLELQYLLAGVSSVKCTKLQVLSGDELLAEKTIIGTLSKVGATYSSQVGASFSMKDVEESKSTNIELNCNYGKTSGETTTNIVKTATQSLGTVTYVNVDV